MCKIIFFAYFKVRIRYFYGFIIILFYGVKELKNVVPNLKVLKELIKTTKKNMKKNLQKKILLCDVKIKNSSGFLIVNALVLKISF